jgi:D-serine deaminase-like pyridoxal phosphate-dependent protein
VLVTNEIVGAAKLERLATLASKATIGVLVDDPANVRHLGAAARAAGSKLDVLIEIEVGMNRCGVAPGTPAVVLAEVVARTPGFVCVEYTRTTAARSICACPTSAAMLLCARRALRARPRRRSRPPASHVRSLPARAPAPGSTSATAAFTPNSQPGSYVFMDADYHRNALAPDEHHFEQSLYVLASVMSAPVRDRAVVDAGLKAFAFDSGLPLVHGTAGLEYKKAADEHGVLAVATDREPLFAGRPRVADPGHCDPTVNLYDWIVGVRGTRVECLWPVAARGALA